MEIEWPAFAFPIGQLVAAVLIGLLLYWTLFVLLRFLARRTRWELDDAFVAALRGPSRLIFPLLALLFVLPALSSLGTPVQDNLRHLVGLCVIGALTWMLIAVVDVCAELVMARYDISVADNIESRRVHTQMRVLERTISVIILILGVAAALMTFPRIREVGATLLMSAGFAGLAIGLAARPVLENLIAGLQLAFTQPIRIDDVVIIQGEWGKIEEITATYVVVRIWDQRRLIVPFSKFISEPFQNWTRSSAEILGTVHLYVDYTVPVPAVRAELERICRGSQDWDERVCILQVTGATETTLELRALVSAADAGTAWNLRVHVREKLVGFLQQEYPECLPRTRVSLSGEAQGEPLPARP